MLDSEKDKESGDFFSDREAKTGMFLLSGRTKYLKVSVFMNYSQ